MATPNNSARSFMDVKDTTDDEASQVQVQVPRHHQQQHSPEIAKETPTPIHDGSNTPSLSGEEKENVEQEFNPGFRFYLAFGSLCVIVLMAALDATSISVALPIMARALHGSSLEAFWSGTSFLLTSTVFQPVLGSFSSIFGRKPLIFFSLALFGAGAIIAAVAGNFTVVLVGRSVQGVGGGGVICLTEIVATDMVPLRERGKWFSVFSAMWSLGTVTGPLLGGGFAQNVSWRWIFWINLPFIGVGTVMIALFLQLNYQTSAFLAKLRRIDWIGIILFLGSSTGFLIPITWGGVQYPWDSWRTLVPLLVSTVGLIAFGIHQEYFAAEPLIRTSVFKNTTALVAYIEAVIHGIILWGWLYYMPLYYEAVKGLSPIMAGVALFPNSLTVAPAAGVTGAMIAVTGKYQWALWSGWILTTLGMGLLVLLKENTSTVAWVFINLVGGVGTGILFPAMSIAIMASVSNRDQALGTNIFSFLRATGQAIGVAVGGVVFQNQMRKKLLTYPLLAAKASEYSKDAAALVEIIKALPKDGKNGMRFQLRVSYTWALQYVWIVMCALAAVALVLNFWTKGYPLDRALETEQGFVEKRKGRDEERNGE